jgi:hypothetical protein
MPLTHDLTENRRDVEDPHIRAWYKRFLAGEFDSSGIFEHPNDPMPAEMFDLEPEGSGRENSVRPVVEMDLGLDEAIVEARIKEIKEKGTYWF